MKQNRYRRTLLDVILLVVLNVLGAASSFAQTQPISQNGDITFNIGTPLEFKGRVVSGPVRKSEIAGLLDLPVRNGKGDFGVEMTGPNHEEIMASTCLQWKRARAEKAYAATTYAMAMEGFLIHTCGLLFELQKATQQAWGDNACGE